MRRLFEDILDVFRYNIWRQQDGNTIATFLTSGPPYSLNMCWHLEDLLLPYPQFFGESNHMRSFKSFPRFEPRFRELKLYLDDQKPMGW